MNKTHSRYYPERVSFVFWKNQRHHNLLSKFTDLHLVHLDAQQSSFCPSPVIDLFWPKGGLQAAEVMLYTIDKVNEMGIMPSGVTLGTHILDDCDKDTYGLQQAVDFIKGTFYILSLVYDRKPFFYFRRSDTKTRTQIGQYFWAQTTI